MDRDEFAAKLNHPKWQVRNLAVKNLGEHSDEQYKNLLISLIKDRRSSSIVKRFLGEPFYQVGFIRRNAWNGLLKQALSQDEFFAILPLGIEDPYYEVRSASWKVLDHMLYTRQWQCSNEWKEHLKFKILKERNFEIMLAMMPLMEKVMEMNEILNFSHKVKTFKSWRVRGAFFDLLCNLFKRKMLSQDQIRAYLPIVHLRSDYFKPIFLLKEKRQNLDRELEAQA